MTIWTWIPLCSIWTCCLVAWIIIFKRVRRNRREITERLDRLAATRAAEQAAYMERQRQYMYQQNREMRQRTRMERGIPVEMTQDEFIAARDKSRNHFLESLTPGQRSEYLSTGDFHVTARGSGNIYKIRGGSYVGNVQMTKGYDTDPWVQQIWGRVPEHAPRFCCHLYAGFGVDFPIWDHLLAQALMLRNDEDRFRKIANPM